jgi:hypothetical protein
MYIILVVNPHEIALFLQLLQSHKQLGYTNASHDRCRESSAMSDGTIRSISIHQTRLYGCDGAVDTQSVRRSLVRRIQQAKLSKIIGALPAEYANPARRGMCNTVQDNSSK